LNGSSNIKNGISSCVHQQCTVIFYRHPFEQLKKNFSIEQCDLKRKLTRQITIRVLLFLRIQYTLNGYGSFSSEC